MNLYRILHVEDNADDAALVMHALGAAPFAFTAARVDNEAAYAAFLDAGIPDAILCDYNLPEFSAERALAILNERGLDVPFIVVSHHIGESAAVVAMQNGASDYLPKGNLRRLSKAVEAAVDRGRVRREKARVQEELRRSEAIRSGILDSLLSRIALLDSRGVIMAVNKAWSDFEANSPGGVREGDDYLRVVRTAGKAGDPFAALVAGGIEDVIGRRRNVFSTEFSVATSAGMRWLIARVVPLEGSDNGAVVSYRDVSDLMLARVALEDANQRLQGLSKRVLAVQEEERRCISRELHDDIGQTLGALKIGLHRLASGPHKPELVNECIAAADDALTKLRGLAMDLRPPQLDQLGLGEALEWLAQRQSATAGLEVTCQVRGLAQRPSACVETACYRIAQEAVNNATRHSQARRVSIGIECEGQLLKLVVRDDGVGFDPSDARRRVARSGSMGLIGMEERAHLAGGRLRLRSVRGAGTTVSAIFPLAGRTNRGALRAAGVAA